MKNKFMKIGLIFILSTVLMGCSVEPITILEPKYETGNITRVEDVYGTFFVYVPISNLAEDDILVLVHGTPATDEAEEDTARYYIEHWLGYAEKYGIVLVAPTFDQENFSSRKGEIEDMMTGYRGLFGREIGADEWVLRIVKAYQIQLFGQEGKFSLYGHSAGGQFVGRFLVTHPEEVEQAVITSAATYPQPNPEIAWPFGMGELHVEIEWDEKAVRQEDVFPDEQNWLAATQIPLTVLVGMNDSANSPVRPGQKGRNRINIARNWVQDMALFAEENGLECRYHYELIPGKGHSMSGLLEYSQQALASK